MTIAAVADNWADEQDHGVGESRDEEAGNKIRSAKLLEEKLHHAWDGAVAQRPGHVTPKEPEGQGRETQSGIRESPNRENFCCGFCRLTWGGGVTHRKEVSDRLSHRRPQPVFRLRKGRPSKYRQGWSWRGLRGPRHIQRLSGGLQILKIRR